MQNLTLFIILLQIPFSFGMFPGSSGHHGFTPTNLYNMADSITQHKSLEKQLRKAKQIIVAAIWQIANKINH
uniref:Secreted protein n=1 Tax=Meloidogyne hapla TaxID=6305 RepID=A0A1I8BV98_MELHA